MNEAFEIGIGEEVIGVKELHGGGTSVVAGVEPELDAGAVVGDVGGQNDRRIHEVQRYRALEVNGNSDEHIMIQRFHD